MANKITGADITEFINLRGSDLNRARKELKEKILARLGELKVEKAAGKSGKLTAEEQKALTQNRRILQDIQDIFEEIASLQDDTSKIAEAELDHILDTLVALRKRKVLEKSLADIIQLQVQTVLEEQKIQDKASGTTGKKVSVHQQILDITHRQTEATKGALKALTSSMATTKAYIGAINQQIADLEHVESLFSLGEFLTEYQKTVDAMEDGELKEAMKSQIDLEFKGAFGELKEVAAQLGIKLDDSLVRFDQIDEKTKQVLKTQQQTLKVFKREADYQEDILKLIESKQTSIYNYFGKLKGVMNFIPGVGKSMNDALNRWRDALSAVVRETGMAIKNGEGMGAAFKNSFKAFKSELATAGSGMSGWKKALLGVSTGIAAAIGLAIYGIIKLGKLGLEEFNKIAEATKDISQSTGVSVAQAYELAQATRDAYRSSANQLSTYEEINNVQKAMIQEFGRYMTMPSDFAAQLSDVAKHFGYSQEEAGKLHSTFLELGADDEMAVKIQTMAAGMAEASKLAPGIISKDLLENQDKLAQNFAGLPKLAAKTAVEVRKMGYNLKIASKVQDHLFQVEQSLTAQMEASVGLNRMIDVSKARQLGLDGDMIGMMKELTTQIGTYEQFVNMSVPQRILAARAAGMEVSELQKGLYLQKFKYDFSEDELKLISEREDIYGNLEKYDAKSLRIKLNEVQAQEKLNLELDKAKSQIAEALLPLVQAVAAVLVDLSPIISGIGKAINKALFPLEWFGDLMGMKFSSEGVDESLQNSSASAEDLNNKVIQINQGLSDVQSQTRDAIKTAAKDPNTGLGKTVEVGRRAVEGVAKVTVEKGEPLTTTLSKTSVEGMIPSTQVPLSSQENLNTAGKELINATYKSMSQGWKGFFGIDGVKVLQPTLEDLNKSVQQIHEERYSSAQTSYTPLPGKTSDSSLENSIWQRIKKSLGIGTDQPRMGATVIQGGIGGIAEEKTKTFGQRLGSVAYTLLGLNIAGLGLMKMIPLITKGFSTFFSPLITGGKVIGTLVGSLTGTKSQPPAGATTGEAQESKAQTIGDKIKEILNPTKESDADKIVKAIYDCCCGNATSTRKQSTAQESSKSKRQRKKGTTTQPVGNIDVQTPAPETKKSRFGGLAKAGLLASIPVGIALFQQASQEGEEGISTGMALLGTVLTGSSGYLLELAIENSDLIKQGFLKAGSLLATGAGTLLKGIGGLTGKLAGALPAMSGVFATIGEKAKGIGGKLAGLFTSNPTTSTQTPAPAGGGSDRRRTSRPSGGGRGPSSSGAGSGISAFLSGMAKGLTSFANPAAAIGAAIFAGVVLSIGKALQWAAPAIKELAPVLKEGLVQIGTVLVEVVKQIAPVIKETLGGLANIIKSVGEAIAAPILAVSTAIETIGRVGGWQLFVAAAGIMAVVKAVKKLRAVGQSESIEGINLLVASLTPLTKLPDITGVDSLVSGLNTVKKESFTTLSDGLTGVVNSLSSLSEDKLAKLEALKETLQPIMQGITDSSVAIYNFKTGIDSLNVKAFNIITQGIEQIGEALKKLDIKRLESLAQIAAMTFVNAPNGKAAEQKDRGVKPAAPQIIDTSVKPTEPTGGEVNPYISPLNSMVDTSQKSGLSSGSNTRLETELRTVANLLRAYLASPPVLGITFDDGTLKLLNSQLRRATK